MRITLLTITIAAAAVCGLAPRPAAGANHNVQVGPGTSYSPSNLTIQAGDSVTWSNVGGGLHNVQASDGSFRCAQGCDGQGGNGAVSSAAWSFTLTFNNPGTIGYFCDLHGSPTAGMRGQVIVEPVATSDEGEIRFSVAAQSRAEDGGSFTVQVDRINGDDGAVSVDYATSDGSAQAGVDYTPQSGTLTWPDNDDSTKSFAVPVLDDGDDEPNETINVALANPGGGASLAAPSTSTLTIQDDDDPAPTPGVLGFASTSYSGVEGSSVTVQVNRQSGNDGAVTVHYATAAGSAGEGVDYQAAEGTLSWANNQSGIRSFSVPLIEDTGEEETETVSLMLSSPTGGATLGASSATLSILDDDGPAECVEDDETLCLVSGRFRIRVDFTVPSTGVHQAGRTVTFGSANSGLFYFFDPSNIEMLIKVLDACELAGFNSYWVFYAATTNVEFTVTVTDTQHQQDVTYSNPANHVALPVLDTAAFATCP